LFKSHDVIKISNNIDLEIFFPESKILARNKLGLSFNDKKIILIGAQSLSDPLKGINRFIDCLNRHDRCKYHVATFGRCDADTLNSVNFQYTNFGFIKDESVLRSLYSSADVFVSPSVIEAFGKTVAESMACGTPAVCFGSTGPDDIVDHKSNGYLAKPNDQLDLALGVEWVLNNDKYSDICLLAKRKIESCFDSKIIASQYIDLYKKLLK
jgi:glycosyltransferase involved in cell wall biosynthesis